MPYDLLKVGDNKYYVVNLITGRRFSGEPLTKNMAYKQLKVLNMIGDGYSDIILKKSNRKDKKYNVIFTKDGKKYNIHFGAKGMSDYTKHKDRYRKYLYEMRHMRNENWQNLESAGA